MSSSLPFPMRARIDLAPHLQGRVDHRHPGGAGELAQLLERGLGLDAPALPAVAEADEERALALAGPAQRRGAGELVLERERPRHRVVGELEHRGRHLVLPHGARGVLRQQVRVVHLPRQAAREDLDGRHEVEAQQREVGVVVAGERLAVEVRVHEPEPAQAVGAGAGAADVRQLELARVAHDHRVDVALAIEEHADLPARSSETSARWRASSGETTSSASTRRR